MDSIWKIIQNQADRHSLCHIGILIKVMSENILEEKIGKPGAFAIYAISGMLAICALLMFLKFCKPKAKIPTRNSVTVIAIPIE